MSDRWSKMFGIASYSACLLLSVINTVITKKVSIKFGIGVLQFLFYRTVICCIILLPFSYKTNFSFLKKENRKSVLSISLHALSIYAWYYAIDKASLNNIAIVSFVIPIFVNIFAILFLKEKISSSLWSAMFCCLFAIMLINQDKFVVSSSNITYHYLLIYLPAFIFVILRSIAIILGKNVANNKKPIELLYYVCFTGLIWGIIAIFIMPFHFKPMSGQVWVYEGWNVVLYLLQMWLMYKAYSLCKVSLLQPVEFTKFIFSVILSYYFLNENVTIVQIIAALIIFISNILLMRKSF